MNAPLDRWSAAQDRAEAYARADNTKRAYKADHVRDDFIRAIDATADSRAEDHEAEMHLANRLGDCLWNRTIGADDELLQRFLSVASKESRRDLLRSFGIGLPRTGQSNARAIAGRPGPEADSGSPRRRFRARMGRLRSLDRASRLRSRLDAEIPRRGADGGCAARISHPDTGLAGGHWTVSPTDGLQCLQRLLQRLERDPGHQYVIDYAEASIRPVPAAAFANPALTETAGIVVGWLLAHGHGRYADLHTPH
ncbi:hypothetical protein FHW79_006403 [Azospirillum sp. OGB3]|uniref:hypothetical protein n=1 Tax=Azospirillum sp. OGB3 TaxID=2587012 RepID=UPI001605A849|nr:hypothetical protein [Azospirillum sp. OGB3]MBB3268728.1 hypothetical protein [Azospirillum sp. OGB3]